MPVVGAQASGRSSRHLTGRDGAARLGICVPSAGLVLRSTRNTAYGRPGTPDHRPASGKRPILEKDHGQMTAVDNPIEERQPGGSPDREPRERKRIRRGADNRISNSARILIAEVMHHLPDPGAGVSERVRHPWYRSPEPIFKLCLAGTQFLADMAVWQLVQLRMLMTMGADLDANIGRLGDLLPAKHPTRP